MTPNPNDISLNLSLPRAPNWYSTQTSTLAEISPNLHLFCYLSMNSCYIFEVSFLSSSSDLTNGQFKFLQQITFDKNKFKFFNSSIVFDKTTLSLIIASSDGYVGQFKWDFESGTFQKTGEIVISEGPFQKIFFILKNEQSDYFYACTQNGSLTKFKFSANLLQKQDQSIPIKGNQVTAATSSKNCFILAYNNSSIVIFDRNFFKLEILRDESWKSFVNTLLILDEKENEKENLLLIGSQRGEIFSYRIGSGQEETGLCRSSINTGWSWIHVRLGMWASGLLGIWASWLLGCWASGLLGSWASGHLGFWASRLLGIWVSGHLSFWASGHMGFWASGLLGIWTSGIQNHPV